jgi:hypothetical protein
MRGVGKEKAIVLILQVMIKLLACHLLRYEPKKSVHLKKIDGR